ncbi:uncharacterized protein EDB93DRAFT_728383 [Suillus bovinus]|uniref:uncharacterized protein n=1 Tax=Suillus bovinus TaxID=48563 RepID=UPI001B85E19D|nr:uncharacterized protein EDB93DRAFT_728383 [Suillus bovinus]KAG2138074.1 hypothetical protein EDB93DRAFT_728383 [Suillus bovinus]
MHGRLVNWTANILTVISGHTHLVWSVLFSPDGAPIVSGSSDYPAGCGMQEQGCHRVSPSESTFIQFHRRPTTPCKLATIMLTDTRNNRTICFPPRFEYAPQNPAKILEGTSHLNPTLVVLEDGGWIAGACRRLLCWVPPASRAEPFYSLGLVLMIPIGLDIDLSRMAHGEHWSNRRDCYLPMIPL